MKSNLILKITNYNWGLIGPGELARTEWRISDDFAIEIKEIYRGERTSYPPTISKTIISKENLKKILNQLEKAKSIDIQVDACDAEGWEFIQYNEGRVVWKRNAGYIYGIAPLEKIAKILNKYAKQEA